MKILAFFAAFVLGMSPAAAQTCKTCSNVTPVHPVILVHGRNDAPARWDTLVASFVTRGYTEGTNLFRLNMSSFCGDNSFCSMLPAPDGTGATYVNESYAKCLQRYIASVLPCVSGVCPAVDIITHSQGGVVARYYARFLAAGEPREVNDLVVMANPGGNGITNCTLAGSCTGVNPEDCPDSAFMKKLNGVAPDGDGSNDETPSAAQPNGPVNYGSVVSTKDTVVVPWCTGYFVQGPDVRQGDDFTCSNTSTYPLDADADQCKLTSGQHLQVPTNTTAINHAYCVVNED